MIESNQIILSKGNNYITTDKLNISTVTKGFIPIIRLISDVTLVTKENDDLYPDYSCFNVSVSSGDLLGLTNLTNLKSAIKSQTSNIAVQFRFDSTVLVNLTLSYAYPSFGTFEPYLYSRYGGNVYGSYNNKLVTIRNIGSYPFDSKLVELVEKFVLILNYFLYI